jgi:hypothetical protein
MKVCVVVSALESPTIYQLQKKKKLEKKTIGILKRKFKKKEIQIQL